MRRSVIIGGLLALTTQFAGAQQLVTVRDQAGAKEYASQHGWLTRGVDSQGRTVELQSIVDGIPRYFITHNINAADSVSTDECWPGGSAGLNLNGAGIMLGIWDGGAVIVTHSEFQGRAVQADGATEYSDHATHVGGTMVAGGVWPGGSGYPPGASRGMAWQASLVCRDWNDDAIEAYYAAASGLRISNHSYGPLVGWYYGDLFGLGFDLWHWLGNPYIDPDEDYLFGRYDEEAKDWDQIACARPRYLFVVSAGNDRDEAGPADPFTEEYIWFEPGVGWVIGTGPAPGPDGPYDCVSGAGIAKNGLMIGAVRDVIGGYGGPASVEMTVFSSWGPADDGRIKPDLVGNGYELFSPVWQDEQYDYWASYSGTSTSTPNISGSLGLLVQHWRETHPDEDDMLSSTLRGLVIHTADECGGADGPDYEYGWGLLNTARAAETISADVVRRLTITESELTYGGEVILSLTTDGTSDELRATICWTDPAGQPPPESLDNPTKMLKNDLDLRIESDAGTVYRPWVLDPQSPSAPATTGDNDTDNVEQVVIQNPGADRFLLTVSHKGSLQGGRQVLSMVVSGAATINNSDCNDNGIPDDIDIADGTSQDCNANEIPDECDIADGTSQDCNANAVPDECDIADGTSSDLNANGVPDECEPDCNANGIPDDLDIADGTSQDCNANAVPDECDIADGTSTDLNGNGIPDDCEPDCNGNGIPDDLDIADGTSSDLNGNGVPDECEPDCNGNGIPDDLDIADGTSSDVNGNGVPDECDPDCNGNGVPDDLDIANGVSQDCNANDVPDECDTASGTSADCNDNNIPDECELDTDGDGLIDDCDGCPQDPDKFDAGQCGCGVPDTDSDFDGVADCVDGCPADPSKVEPGACGCGVPDTDSDLDGLADCIDGCPQDPDKTEPGVCGCGRRDIDTDGDGTVDCVDLCPDDPLKTLPGLCGCGAADSDRDGDGIPDCRDNCPGASNTTQTDTDCDGFGDACDNCPRVWNPDQVDADRDGLGDTCDGYIKVKRRQQAEDEEPEDEAEEDEEPDSGQEAPEGGMDGGSGSADDSVGPAPTGAGCGFGTLGWLPLSILGLSCIKRSRSHSGSRR